MNSVTKRLTGLGISNDRGKPSRRLAWWGFSWRIVIGSERVDQCGSFGSFGPFLLGVGVCVFLRAVWVLCALWLGCATGPRKTRFAYHQNAYLSCFPRV